MKGLKISLEGIDGVGKTTQLGYIADYLGRQGHDVLIKPCRNNAVSSDIDGTLLGVLKSTGILKEHPVTDALLAAARTAYIDETTVNPHMARGGLVLADRDIDTAVAYSLPGLRERYPHSDADELIRWSLGLYAVNHAIPDLTLYLHADPEVALRRALDDDSPNERAIYNDTDLQYMRLVQNGYRRLVDSFPERIQQIEVNDMSIEEVSTTITMHIDQLQYRSRSDD